MQNGVELSQLVAVSESEVTGAVHLADRSQFLTVGWSRLISLYDDSKADVSSV